MWKWAFEVSLKNFRAVEEPVKSCGKSDNHFWMSSRRLNKQFSPNISGTLNPGPTMHPRELMKKLEELPKRFKVLAGKAEYPMSWSIRAKANQEEWRKRLPHVKRRKPFWIVRFVSVFHLILFFEKSIFRKAGSTAKYEGTGIKKLPCRFKLKSNCFSKRSLQPRSGQNWKQHSLIQTIFRVQSAAAFRIIGWRKNL